MILSNVCGKIVVTVSVCIQVQKHAKCSVFTVHCKLA